MSTYIPNIPQPSDNPSQSQDQILQNFQSINTVNSVNHVAFNDSDQGKHKFLQMPQQSSAPITAADEAAIYTKDISGLAQLFFREESNGIERQLTNLPITTVGTNKGITTPWGIKINWGTYSTLATSLAITFAVAFVGTPIITLGREDNVTPTNKYVSYLAGSVTNTGFTVIGSAASFNGSYIAIGT